MKAITGILFPAVMIAVSFSGAVLAADFERGQEAFRAGDYSRALEVWQPLAREGNANAQFALGLMHEYGRGVKADDGAAVEWFEKAAEQDLPEAQYRLGVLHENGWGVERDAGVAAGWYRRAAERGHPLAQHDLAILHLEGKGVPENGVEAYKWLRIASAQRADLMAKHLRMVSKRLNAEEITEAERLAQEWLQSRQ